MTAEQLLGIAELARKYGRGKGEVTDRQDVQLHWIEAEEALEIFQRMDGLGFTTDMCGQGFTGAKYGDVRNIVCCPVSGIEEDELIDVYPLARELTDFFTGNRDFLDLPRKFKIAISGCGSDCTRVRVNDLGLLAVEKDNEVGFTMMVGGGVGTSLPGPKLAEPTFTFIKPEDAFDVVVTSVEIYRDYGSRKSKAEARFKWLINEWGVKKFLSVLEEKTGRELERYNGPLCLDEEDHRGIRPQRQGGHYYVHIPLIGGLLTAHDMIELAELAEEYGNGELRLTPQQNIIVPNVKDRDAAIGKLKRSGFQLHKSSLRCSSIGCPSDFCGKTRDPHAKDVVKSVVKRLETCFNLTLLNDAVVKVHVSGCPNDCCAARAAVIGFQGKLAREGSELKQRYSLLLGGEPAKSKLARQIVEKASLKELENGLEALLKKYVELKRDRETFAEFCNRHTTEELKSYLNGG
ncbi:nitrite/sulfite reductase [Candidatus Bathyarchaeota archaeon]|nr:nitrite/sulfite reductase [Candidatus Bathyarchaeota archaeon]